MNTKKSILLLFFFGLILLHFGQTSSPLTDEVKVLKLDQELPARSQLGGVVVDRLGFVYVSNFHDAVWKISPQGKVKLLTDGLYGSSGNTIDARGNLYQANFFSHTIVKIDRYGKITPFIESGLSGPVGMVFDPEGQLYVCNFNTNSILRISPDKQIEVFASGAEFNGPNGITIDTEGNLYVVNFITNDVVKVSKDGKASIFTEIPGTDGNAHIAFFNDNFYVTKIKSNRVYRVNRAGVVKLLAGTGKTGITEGPALSATFSAPNGIGVDPVSGLIYVNNVNGVWTSQQASTIELSSISILSISKQLSHFIDNNDTESAKKAFEEYLKDPFHAQENISAPVSALAWQYMVKRNVAASITLFSWVQEAYPEQWRSYYNLGEVYKIIGQPDKAITYYEKALEKQPNNPQVKSRLKELKK